MLFFLTASAVAAADVPPAVCVLFFCICFRFFMSAKN